MAQSSNVRKALQLLDGAKQKSSIRPLTFPEIVLKLAELHNEKSKDFQLSDIGQRELHQQGGRGSEPRESSFATITAIRKEDIIRKAVQAPPSPCKSPKNLTKNTQIGEFRSPAAGGLASSAGSPKSHTSSAKESKPSSKATPLTQLLGKNQGKNGEMNKVLVSVNICGSTGSFRFLVDVKDPVKRIAELALRAYAREGRFPRLGTNCKLFDLYCANSDFKALDPMKPVGSLGTRHFLLYKRRDEDIDDPDVQPDHAGSLPRKFMWTVMSSIVCSL